jgi:hypothetical protein
MVEVSPEYAIKARLEEGSIVSLLRDLTRRTEEGGPSSVSSVPPRFEPWYCPLRLSDHLRGILVVSQANEFRTAKVIGASSAPADLASLAPPSANLRNDRTFPKH